MGERFDVDLVGGFSLTRELYDWIESAILAVICMLLLFMFVGRMVSVDGRPMQDTLNHADRLICTRVGYVPKRGDIVVVTKPLEGGEPLIKRVIATGGETVDIDFGNGIVYVDGVELSEGYIKDLTHKRFDVDFPQTVPEGHVFIMGDNRNNSWDSRASEVGMVDVRYILGKAIFRVMPYDKIGILE